MTTKHVDVVKDIRTAVRLEQELQISYTQKGVCVVDVYSAEWGPCKAINETFRRLASDQMDGTALRFVSAECHSILKSLNCPDAERNHQRPKNLDAIRDTLPEAWQGVLEERAGLSKPYFMFFKDGKRCGIVNGVNTPIIQRMTKELCSVKIPAHENISNAELLDFWEEHFNGDESEVSFEKFIHSLGPSCDAYEPLDSDEKFALMDVLHIKPEVNEKIVTAEALQRWIGDDETISNMFHQLLPDYKSRTEQAKIKREIDRKRRLEEEEARRLEEAAEARERAAKELQQKKQRLLQLSSDIEELTARTQLSTRDVESSENLEMKRDALANVTKEGIDIPEWKITFQNVDNEVYFTQLVSALTSCGTFYSHLRQLGMSVVDLLDAQQAVEAFLATSILEAPGLLGGLCVSSFVFDIQQLLAPASEKEVFDYYESAVGDELVAKHPTLALHLLHTSIMDQDAPVLYFYGKKESITGFDLLKEGDQVTMNAFTLLHEEPPTKTLDETEVMVTVEGIPQAIFLEHISIRNTKQVMTHWVSKHDVIESSEQHIKIRFSSFLGDLHLSSIMEATETDVVQDIDEITGIGRLRQYVQDENKIIASMKEDEDAQKQEEQEADEETDGESRHKHDSHREEDETRSRSGGEGSQKAVDEEEESKSEKEPAHHDDALVDAKPDQDEHPSVSGGEGSQKAVDEEEESKYEEDPAHHDDGLVDTKPDQDEH
eukprot:Tbor_TRINITY_DN4019_c0_g1::TRINITY_DN4019_c0_g1_i1::g.11733::m.11733